MTKHEKACQNSGEKLKVKLKALNKSNKFQEQNTLKARFSGKTVVASLFAILIFSGKTGFTCQKLREKNFCDSFLFSVRPVFCT